MTNENRKDEAPRSFLAQWATNTVAPQPPAPSYFYCNQGHQHGTEMEADACSLAAYQNDEDLCEEHPEVTECLTRLAEFTVDEPDWSHAERVLALDIFRDMRGVKADPEREPEAWTASLEYAREELARDRYEMDQQERTGAPYPEEG